MARKKKTEDWLDQQANEINEAFADELSKATEKDIPKIKGKKGWPKITVGSHSTRTEYEDGRVEFETDWEALQRDVRAAIASYESRMNCDTPEVKAPTKRTRKKQ